MPKSAKKKASADFTKTKAKLGKGKQLANNATDTSYRSRTIALPQQSINSIHPSSNSNPTNFRNETLDDLLVQTRHYNAAKRKDGIVAIKSLLTQYPHLTTSTLNFVLPSLVRLIPDEEPLVRKTLQNFFSWYFESLPVASLIPYQNSMILFTTSAMSHIFNHVRLDAVKTLDILLRFCPAAFRDSEGAEEIMSTNKLFGGSSNATSSSNVSNSRLEESSSNAEKVLKCYLNLMGIEYDASVLNNNGKEKVKNQFATASTTSTDLSSSSKLLLFRSFTQFLRVISNQSISRSSDDSSTDRKSESSSISSLTSCPTWFFKPSFLSSDSEFEAFKKFFKSGDSSFEFEKGSIYSFLDSPDSIQNHDCSRSGQLGHDSSMMDIGCQSFDKGLGVNDLNKELRNLDSLMHFGLDTSTNLDHYADQVRSQSSSSSSASGYSILASLLHPLLLTTYLDSSPSSSLSHSSSTTSSLATDRTNSSPLDIDSELISSILQLSLILWRGISKSLPSSSASGSRASSFLDKVTASQLKSQADLMLRMFPLFPLGSKNPNLVLGNLSTRSRETLKEMNLNYCELIALISYLSMGYRTSTDDDDVGGSGSGGRDEQDGASALNLDQQILKVGEFLTATLRESSQSQGNLMGSSSTTGIETYRSMLPIIWLLLNSKNKFVNSKTDGAEISGFKHSFSFGYDDERFKSKAKKGSKGKETRRVQEENHNAEEALPMNSQILQALLDHYEKLGASNKTKVLAFEFIARLSLLHTFPGHNSFFKIKPSSPLRQNFSSWFRTLPKYLWELGSKDPSTSEKILKFLKEVVGRSDGRIFNSDDIDHLTQSLSPYFHISHPSRGEIQGPYSRLPSRVQTRAQGLVYFLLEPQTGNGHSQADSEAEKRLRESVKKAGVVLVQ